MTLEIKNGTFDTSPIFEALVSQASYVGIWKCENNEDGEFYQVDYNLVGHMHPEDKNKTHPPRRVIVGAGWFEDHLSRSSDRKPSVFVRTFEEAMTLVTEDIAEHKLGDLKV